MGITFLTGRKNLSDALEDRLVTPTVFGKKMTDISRFSSQDSAYPIPLPSPLNIMCIALFAASERLKNIPVEKLLEPRQKDEYKFASRGHRNTPPRTPQITEIVGFKEDSLLLDILPEQEITKFLLGVESYDDTEFHRARIWYSTDPTISGMYGFHRERLGPWDSRLESFRGIISEECGIFPKVEKIDGIKRIFVLDPLDGSSLLGKIIRGFKGNDLEERLKQYMEKVPSPLIAPGSSISLIEREFQIEQMDYKQKVVSSMFFNLGTQEFYVIDSNKIRKFKFKLNTSSSNQVNMDLVYGSPSTLEFRCFSECDRDRFLCHNTQGSYQRNLDSLNLPKNMSRYNLPNTPGPARPFFLTEEGRDFKPRFILYNGEKISEWIGSKTWFRTTDQFNMYVVSNCDAPEKGGHSMAPTPERSIFDVNGNMEMSKLNSDPNPAQYRSTIAFVYKQDRELNQHFRNIGAMQVAI
jgi:hypothetical protein